LYALFGAGCGLLGAAVYYGLDRARGLFGRLRAGTLWGPPLAGLGVGLIGLVLPDVLGGGYSTDPKIFSGELGVRTLALLAPLKLLAFVVAFGGGLSGGMLSPNFMAGASLGALFAHGMNALAPGLHLNPTAFALAGAGALFGSASRAPLTMTVLTFELVGKSRAIVPLAVANVVAAGVASLLLKYPIQAQRLLRRRPPPGDSA
jgi:CIC family chloride channel protein